MMSTDLSDINGKESNSSFRVLSITGACAWTFEAIPNKTKQKQDKTKTLCCRVAQVFIFV